MAQPPALNQVGDLVKHEISTRSGDVPSTLTTFQGAVNNLLGVGLSISRNVGERRSATHATTGIPYAIAGTATLVEQRVSAKLLTFKDPIKALLGIGIHKDERVIIRRKYVASSAAIPVPEHAAARTVSMQEDVREVQLTRYGHDLEMNLNLFLRPEDASVELEMKLEACQIALENALISRGYEQVMDDGIDYVEAIARSKNKTSLQNRTDIYCNYAFGIFAKSNHPIASLMIGAKMASAYSVGTSNKALMIVPFMTPEIMKYSKPQWTNYDLSGIPISARDKLDLKVPGGYKDEVANCTIYQHIPPVNIEHGVPNPTIANNLLSKEVVIYSTFDLRDDETIYFHSYKTGKRTMLSNVCYDAHNNPVVQYISGQNRIFRRTVFKMASAILGVSGKETGELLHAYSSCGVSTNPTTELGRLQLRAWLGAVVYKPENILIIPDVAFESVVQDQILFGFKSLPDGRISAEQAAPFNCQRIIDVENMGDRDQVMQGASQITQRELNERDSVSGFRPLYPKYCAHSRHHRNGADVGELLEKVDNSGPLGYLDCPAHIPKINGTAPFTEFIAKSD